MQRLPLRSSQWNSGPGVKPAVDPGDGTAGSGVSPDCPDPARMLGVLPQLYAATLQPDACSKILHWLAAVFGTGRAIFIRLDRLHPRDSFMELIGVPDEIAQGMRLPGSEDEAIWLPRLVEVPTGEIFCTAELVSPEDEAGNSRWLRHYRSLPAGLEYALGVVIENNAHYFASIACFGTTGSFDEPARNTLRALAPHIQLAWDISRRVAMGDAGRRDAMISFEQVHQALVVLDKSGNVIVINEAARRLLGEGEGEGTGLRLKDGRFTFDDPAIQTEFERSVRTVVASMLNGPQVPPQELRVPGGKHRAACALTVVPLYRRESRLVLPPEALCMVAISDHGGINPLPIGHLVWLYGLTPSEARICEALHRSGSVEAAAKSLNVTRHTVRSHLKNIYAKVGVANQSQLLQRLLNTSYQRFYDKALGNL